MFVSLNLNIFCTKYSTTVSPQCHLDQSQVLRISISTYILMYRHLCLDGVEFFIHKIQLYLLFYYAMAADV